MSFDPNTLNPADLAYYAIDLKFLLEELDDRLVALQSQSAQNFPNDFSRGEHAGQIAALISLIQLVKTNMYPTRPLPPT